MLTHSLLLMRELSEDVMALQRGKVVNRGLAAEPIDTLLIRPGEAFSFNRIVGNCTRRQGYVEGMRLSNGNKVGEELMKRNCALVKYEPAGLVVDCTVATSPP